MSRTRVLLADDHRMVAEGMKGFLSKHFEVVGLVEDGVALVEAAAKLKPDVIVADISMPRMSGFAALDLLRKANPAVKVVFITMHSEVAYVRRALEAGASGFVLKASAPSELVTAIRAALEGRTFVTPELADELAPGVETHPRHVKDAAVPLTLRQREILQLLAGGKTLKEIAAVLGVSVRTVEFHKYRGMEAAGVHTVAELIQFAIKNGLVSI